MRPWITLTFVLLLSACTTPRIGWVDKPPFHSHGLKLYTLRPIRVLPTYQASDSVASEKQEIEELLRASLELKGYKVAPATVAQFQVELRITSLPPFGMSPEESRFIKGARGSNFPNANPRAASAARDGVEISFFEQRSNKELWKAWCALPAGPTMNYGHPKSQPQPQINGEDVTNCIKEMISELAAL